MVAAAHEEGKIGFVEVDRIIAMRSDTYRRSRERLALLEHHSLAPPTRNLYTDADLGIALAEARKFGFLFQRDGRRRKRYSQKAHECYADTF